MSASSARGNYAEPILDDDDLIDPDDGRATVLSTGNATTDTQS